MIDEGVIKFDSRWQQSPPLELTEIDDLLEWRQPLFAAGLIGHYEEFDVGFGNLSARVGDSQQFVISGSQTGHVARPTAAHFALVTDFSIELNFVAAIGPVEASSESLTHAALYALSDAIRAVVHVHSEELWVRLMPSLPSTRESVAYGTPQMALEFGRLFQQTTFADSGVARMAGHAGGLISFGSSVREAAERILALGIR